MLGRSARLLMRREVTLKKLIRRKCYDALQNAGFVRFSKEGVDFPFDEEFSCWVGLNTSVNSGEVELTPFVGIHASSLEKLAASLKGKRYDRAVATFSVSMGELDGAKNERAFVFTPEQSESFLDSEAERIARLYDTVGKDYASSMASYQKLLPMLESRSDMLGGYPESVVCCLYLMGKETEAITRAKNFLATEKSYFSGFYKRFSSFVGHPVNGED